MSNEAPVKIGSVQHPVADVPSAVRFYRDTLGLDTKFVDGQRYAALDAGSTTLALAAPTEDVTGGIVAAAFKVPDLDAALEAIIAHGGEVVRPAETGPHEMRAVASDPWGNTLVLYMPTPD